jgi:hypothetical protein
VEVLENEELVRSSAPLKTSVLSMADSIVEI